MNWAANDSRYDLKAGRELFGKPVLGGLDTRRAALIDGPEARIVGEVRAAADLAGRDGFILGADCTLPTDASRRRLRLAVEAAHAL